MEFHLFLNTRSERNKWYRGSWKSIQVTIKFRAVEHVLLADWSCRDSSKENKSHSPCDGLWFPGNCNYTAEDMTDGGTWPVPHFRCFVRYSFVSFCSVQFSSVQFKMVSMRAENPICAPPRLSEVSPTLSIKRFQCSSDWRWPSPLVPSRPKIV